MFDVTRKCHIGGDPAAGITVGWQARPFALAILFRIRQRLHLLGKQGAGKQIRATKSRIRQDKTDLAPACLSNRSIFIR
jgi:hypothetical protein